MTAAARSICRRETVGKRSGVSNFTAICQLLGHFCGSQRGPREYPKRIVVGSIPAGAVIVAAGTVEFCVKRVLEAGAQVEAAAEHVHVAAKDRAVYLKDQSGAVGLERGISGIQKRIGAAPCVEEADSRPVGVVAIIGRVSPQVERVGRILSGEQIRDAERR